MMTIEWLEEYRSDSLLVELVNWELEVAQQSLPAGFLAVPLVFDIYSQRRGEKTIGDLLHIDGVGIAVGATLSGVDQSRFVNHSDLIMRNLGLFQRLMYEAPRLKHTYVDKQKVQIVDEGSAMVFLGSSGANILSSGNTILANPGVHGSSGRKKNKVVSEDRVYVALSCAVVEIRPK